MKLLKRIRCVVAFLLCFSFLAADVLAVGTSIEAELGGAMTYSIDIPYEYPVVAGTEEWAALESRSDMARVCMIPEAVLSQLTTLALLKSILNYPLLGDILAYQPVNDGFQRIYRSFNGLQELLLRDDILAVLEGFSSDELNNMSFSEDYKLMHARVFLEILKQVCTHQLGSGAAPAAFTVPATTTLYTPAGSPISAYVDHDIYLYLLINPDLEDADERVADEIASQERYYSVTYPTAVKLQDYDPRCNCHSFALYGEGNVNRYWISDPMAYYTDGSLNRVNDSHYPQYALYYNGSSEPEYEAGYYLHTAIRSGEDRYYSKWGCFGVYRHSKTKNPYYEDSTGVSYWRLWLSALVSKAQDIVN